ncbi:putative lipoprotein NlpE involved in copper resistance [Vibrio sp. ES.051]|uniref:copper resistance protein NlpE n=1 Tax=Vibrio sp. ES.051 TaxID=1761909 RepID=UPI000BF96773|nr:copper resistance protein NlpE [Vibrio sp. ES.051]PFG57751.1 putative lipoprotein NlpE involved in copper resistance [Vibrio sp. ES.051]
MKKVLLALTGAVIILTGCQDEKPTDTSAVEVPPETEVTTEALPVEEEQVITAETFMDSEHNAQNALDWNGTYKGTLPCADCSGIDTTLILNQDGTYMLEESYQDKEDGQSKSEGQFTWDANGSIVTLANEEVPNQYFVGENVLMKLDMNGEKVTGDLAPLYNLTKQ